MPRHLRVLLEWLRGDPLLLALAIALPLLAAATRAGPRDLIALVDWETVAALMGLMVLSRGLEESGYLTRAGASILRRARTERVLAAVLVLFSAVLSTVLTNDVALFIVVPLTIGLRSAAEVPLVRLVVFEALAVNAGSAVSPIGNPQNLHLWRSSGVGFLEFAAAMVPLAGALMLVLLGLVRLAFPADGIRPRTDPAAVATDRRLLRLAILLYPLFLIATDLGLAIPAALGVVLIVAIEARRILLGVQWSLLVVFILMFLDLGLLASIPAVGALAEDALTLPRGAISAGALLSQLISNVPAAIFLQPFTPEWRDLAWGVSVGGFGLAIGSLANLIALRLAPEPGAYREFHRWSMLMFGVAYFVAAALARVTN